MKNLASCLFSDNVNRLSLMPFLASFITTIVSVAIVGCEKQEFLPVNNDNTKGPDKVEMCHDGHTISVSPNAVQAHLGHGDLLGSCEDNALIDLINSGPNDETVSRTHLQKLSTFGHCFGSRD